MPFVSFVWCLANLNVDTTTLQPLLEIAAQPKDRGLAGSFGPSTMASGIAVSITRQFVMPATHSTMVWMDFPSAITLGRFRFHGNLPDMSYVTNLIRR